MAEIYPDSRASKCLQSIARKLCRIQPEFCESGSLKFFWKSIVVKGQIRDDVNRKERDKLILKYAPLVKSIVDRIACKVPGHVAERSDLVNVGVIGLISALEKFDKTRNVQFETYARFRIRGAVLDELRARDWQPRSARNKDARLENYAKAIDYAKLAALP